MFVKQKINLKKNFLLNFGPQHPAAHGVLRLILILKGEKIVEADPHIGFLHRGTEKLIETKTYLQAIPYFDRLDYVSTMCQEHSYILAIETLLNLNIPKEISITRTIFDELTRLLNHLMSILTHALDIGALTPFLWGFEEREKIMEFYEQVSGGRLHTAYYRIGGVKNLLTPLLITQIYNFVDQFYSRISELEDILNNFIWYERLSGIGFFDLKKSLNYGFSGPMLRGSGLPWDIRKTQPYAFYKHIDFNIPTSLEGDCYSRYLIRISEMYSSLNIIKNCLNELTNLQTIKNNSTTTSFFLQEFYSNIVNSDMEKLINHFKYYSQGLLIPEGQIYGYIEAPKGEFGVMLISSGTEKPFRCKIKSPGFLHLQSISEMSKEHFLADLVTIIGTQDIVFGEIDR